jgi:hypothetical protein
MVALRGRTVTRNPVPSTLSSDEALSATGRIRAAAVHTSPTVGRLPAVSPGTRRTCATAKRLWPSCRGGDVIQRLLSRHRPRIGAARVSARLVDTPVESLLRSPVQPILIKSVLGSDSAARTRGRKLSARPIESILATRARSRRRESSMHRNRLVVVVAESRHLRPATSTPSTSAPSAAVARTAVRKSPVVHLPAVRPVPAVMEEDLAPQPIQSPAQQPKR